MIPLKLKYKPEDFIVQELINIKTINQSNVLLFKITKKNINTLSLINKLYEILQKTINLKIKINFLGMKDKYSLSTQYISLTIHNENNSKQNIENLIEQIIQKINSYNFTEIKFIGFIEKPLKLENLKGNKFLITIRDIHKKEINCYIDNISNLNEIGYFLNYFDYQRVKIKIPKPKSMNNLDDLKDFLQEIIQNMKILEIYPNREKNIRKFNFIKYRDSQIINSLKFNLILSLILLNKVDSNFKVKAYLKDNIIVIPSLEFNDISILKDLLKQIKNEKINNRELIAEIMDLKFSFQEDEFHSGRYKIKLEFTLGPGSYATCLIKHIIPYVHFSRLKYKPLVIN